MWALENETPFAADRGWMRDRDGAEVWLVAVKGTFAIGPDGALTAAEKQEPVCLAPKYRGEPGTSSLLYDGEVTAPKAATDVLLNGTAYAPKGRRAPFTDVLMKVGPVSKALRVFGDRYWRPALLGMKLSEPEPFEKLSLAYERAYGGPDRGAPDPEKAGWEERNPVGLGFAARPDRLGGQRGPNVEDPAALITAPRDRPRPAGYGAIARHWLPRRKYGGTYDAAWEKERQPLVPKDFDDRFYQCAPEDQQVPGHLKGGESVELFNLTPEGRLKFVLPRVTLGFRTFFGVQPEEHRGVLHSVILEPDVPRVLMIWHSHLPCHPRVLKLRGTKITLKTRLDHVGGEPVAGLAGAKESR